MNDYELIDFGDGRKLERIAGLLLDRPSPAADFAHRSYPKRWLQADGRFERTGQDRGSWQWRTRPPEPWVFNHDSVALALRPTPFGHLGVFPEHAQHWSWLRQTVANAKALESELRILNLVGYTGGATLACAGPGVEVVHVDASKPTVQWARENASLSGKAEQRIRWIVDDARDFCRREVKRGRSYHGIILDPPSYGHGLQGDDWSIERDLSPLLADCSTLLERTGWIDHADRLEQSDLSKNAQPPASFGFLLFTCHSPNFDQSTTEGRLLRSMPCLTAIPRAQRHLSRVQQFDAQRRSLDFGIVSRWIFDPRTTHH